MKNLFCFLAFLLTTTFLSAQVTDVILDNEGPNDFLLDGNTLYFTTEFSVKKIDVTESNPVVTTLISGLDDALGLALKGDTMYVSDYWQSRIVKFNVNDASPVLEVVVSMSGFPNNLVLIDNDLYYSNNSEGAIGRVDISQANPVVENIFTGLTSPIGLAHRGNEMYVSDPHEDNISKFDYTDPNPTMVEVLDGIDWPLDIHFHGHDLYITEFMADRISKINVSCAVITPEVVVSSVNAPRDIFLVEEELFITETGENMIVKAPVSVNFDFIVACNEYTWIDGITYTESNYTAVFAQPLPTDCDDQVTLYLTLNEVNTAVDTAGSVLTAELEGGSYQWVDCDNGFAEIVGETNQVFEPSTNGSYAVVVTDDDCTDTSGCITVAFVGVEDLAAFEQIKISPNPSNGQAEIDFGTLQQVGLEVFSPVSQLLLKEEQINTSTYQIDLMAAPGVYFVRVIYGGADRVYKLVKI